MNSSILNNVLNDDNGNETGNESTSSKYSTEPPPSYESIINKTVKLSLVSSPISSQKKCLCSPNHLIPQTLDKVVMYGKGTPTLIPCSSFNVHMDAKCLQVVLTSKPNKEDIIKILACRSLEQRIQIRKRYTQLCGTSLINDLSLHCYANFLRVCAGLLLTPMEYFVKEMFEAIHHRFDHDSVIDMFCCMSNDEIHAFKIAYEEEYRTPLEMEICTSIDLDIREDLLLILQGNRDETETMTDSLISNDLLLLTYSKDILPTPTELHELTINFRNILLTRSLKYLAHLLQEYKKLRGCSIEKCIKQLFPLNQKQLFLCIVRLVESPKRFFAKRLERSMRGMGTNNEQLTRIIVMRCEIDLYDIKLAFQQMMGKSLRSWVKGDTSGSYKHILYELMGEKRSS